ncbi:MAG TPA: ferritin family protein [Acidobacteriota bacterium]|jgi:rubrerythrin|nr:ferritin family protein [Acidobacteriota bacterium]HNT18126.1 ferritin family protein [Acidobacteriota bacterium]HPA27107.1 ferritin family protein [Acidobacteriota bacterium]HQO20763.1 ferritin family protein [Acidobacteriota bacterium]HQQ47563.1 ferritin family protein [Acidobacteriota bacterium]
MNVEDYQKIIETAVAREIESFDFYTGVSEKTSDPALKSLFKELAKEEKGHKGFLETMLANPVPFRVIESEDYKVSETVQMPSLSVDMKPSDAIALAMKKEEEAMKMYAGLAAVCGDKEQREVFVSLSRMELEHKKKLEDMYVSMAMPEAW